MVIDDPLEEPHPYMSAASGIGSRPERRRAIGEARQADGAEVQVEIGRNLVNCLWWGVHE